MNEIQKRMKSSISLVNTAQDGIFLSNSTNVKSLLRSPKAVTFLLQLQTSFFSISLFNALLQPHSNRRFIHQDPCRRLDMSNCQTIVTGKALRAFDFTCTLEYETWFGGVLWHHCYCKCKPEYQGEWGYTLTAAHLSNWQPSVWHVHVSHVCLSVQVDCYAHMLWHQRKSRHGDNRWVADKNEQQELCSSGVCQGWAMCCYSCWIPSTFLSLCSLPHTHHTVIHIYSTCSYVY